MDSFRHQVVDAVRAGLAPSIQRFGPGLRHWLRFFGGRRIVAGLMATALAVAAGWWLMRPAAAPVEVRLPMASVSVPSLSVPTVDASVVPGRLRVHVTGAVRRPGVYTLDAGARVVDAVRAAGGATDSADLERINLAQTILDTEQVMVPRRTASRPKVTVAPRHVPRPPVTTTSPGSPSLTHEGSVSAPLTSAPSSSRVNLNTASVDELDTLPGIGPATAKAIVSHRTRKGPFSRLEDLMAIDGIGPKKIDAIRDLVSL